ncbi:biotin/lipoyl-containing protein [Stieleria marina]|uniref:biotin/lipoyl-containing protein n=1 Tax=Stieleria marina TaxID=1930275 RepID=UPI003AF3F454
MVGAKLGNGIKNGQPWLPLEAMKMEAILHAEQHSTFSEILLKPEAQVGTGNGLTVVV